MWSAVGLVVVLVCAGLGAALAGAVDHRQPVVVTTHTLEAGQVVAAGDLGYARVAGRGLATVSDPAAVIGKVTSGRLPAGSPVVPGELVGPSSSGDANSVVVPIGLKAGMFPPGLAAGDQVLLVVTTPPAAGSTAQSAPPPVPGRVAAVAADRSFGSSSSTTVTVTVDRVSLPVLATAAAAGQVLVAKVGA